MIHVIAIITTLPGMRSTVLDEFRAIVPQVRQEEGCIEYQPVLDSKQTLGMQTNLGDDTFIVIEKWQSLEALQAHATALHMIDYAKRVSGKITDRNIHVLENVTETESS